MYHTMLSSSFPMVVAYARKQAALMRVLVAQYLNMVGNPKVHSRTVVHDFDFSMPVPYVFVYTRYPCSEVVVCVNL